MRKMAQGQLLRHRTFEGLRSACPQVDAHSTWQLSGDQDPHAPRLLTSLSGAAESSECVLTVLHSNLRSVESCLAGNLDLLAHNCAGIRLSEHLRIG